jgi:hypothetical protein
MTIKTIALLYPGNMGSDHRGAATSGARVVWASEQAKPAGIAKRAGLFDVGV